MKAAFTQWCIAFLRRTGYVVMPSDAPSGQDGPTVPQADIDWCIGFLQRAGYEVTSSNELEGMDDLRVKLAAHKLDADRGRIESFLLLQKLRGGERS